MQAVDVQQLKKGEDQDLLRAIKLSGEEEAARKKSVDDANANSLFDEQAQV